MARNPRRLITDPNEMEIGQCSFRCGIVRSDCNTVNLLRKTDISSVVARGFVCSSHRRACCFAVNLELPRIVEHKPSMTQRSYVNRSRRAEMQPNCLFSCQSNGTGTPDFDVVNLCKSPQGRPACAVTLRSINIEAKTFADAMSECSFGDVAPRPTGLNGKGYAVLVVATVATKALVYPWRVRYTLLPKHRLFHDHVDHRLRALLCTCLSST